ncbi:hypothetical protein ABPG77_003504 [Micractinium sp. CCAP 211/92]
MDKGSTDLSSVARRRGGRPEYPGVRPWQAYEELLDEGFKMREQLRDEAGHPRSYGKADWIELMCGCVAPAIPDFNWSAVSDGEVDKDGFAIVAVKVSGHHTGAPFAPPGLPPVPAEGRRVALEQQLMRVRVEGGRIREIEVSAACVASGQPVLQGAVRLAQGEARGGACSRCGKMQSSVAGRGCCRRQCVQHSGQLNSCPLCCKRQCASFPARGAAAWL